MSPASRSKSKDKKAVKESSKAPLKPSSQASSGGGIPASGYNPLLGTFHTIESATGSSAPAPHVNGRFRNIDEPDDHDGNSLGPAVEYDIVSNNDSWSGDSEDHKEKTSHPPRPDAVPGADNDKREKIRQKNERKHQRQKERRAQELHERCTGYLMSRKLEALAQQLVGMGFSQERSTMALILNEGRVEESVNWLFEGGEESNTHREHKLDNGNNLKIDISEELARMADMENRYKCSKQEVERAVVTCEGDLDKAEEGLRTQKQEPQTSPHKPEETGDPPTVGSGNFPSVDQNSVRAQPKLTTLTIMQQKRDEKDLNYTKAAATSVSAMDPKNMHSLKRIQPKTEWGKPQQLSASADKKWSSAVSNPSLSYSLGSPSQASPPPAKSEARYMVVGNEVKSLQLGSVREPVTMMHRPVNSKPIPTSSVSSSPPATAAGWYPINVESVKANGSVPNIPSSRSPSPNSASMNPMYSQFHYQQQLPQSQYVSSSGSVESVLSRINNPMWSRSGTSPTLAAASSLGLFSGLGTSGFSGSSSPVDWNNGGMLHLDYTNIDWSVDRGSSLSRSGAPWPRMNSFPQNNSHGRQYTSYTSGLGSMRGVVPNLDAISIARLQQDGIGPTETSAGASREWTSPFEERDLFSLSRQFVSSPSL